MTTLYYPAAGFDFAPMRLGITAGHTYFYRKKFIKKGGNQNIIDKLDAVRHYILVDIIWNNNCNLFDSEEEFITFMKVLMRHFFKSKCEVSKADSCITWTIKQYDFKDKKYDTITIDYFYGIDIFEKLPSLLQNKLEKVDIVYQQGFFIENDKKEILRFNRMFKNLKYIIHQKINNTDEKCCNHEEDMNKYLCICNSYRFWFDDAKSIHKDLVIIESARNFAMDLYK